MREEQIYVKPLKEIKNKIAAAISCIWFSVEKNNINALDNNSNNEHRMVILSPVSPLKD